jgi:ABC-2 type transport system ATP-binding protein
LIEVQHLTKRYGDRTAVDDVSFRVQKGEIVGFLGPNGAGKSTTLRMLTGFLAASAGAVRIDGVDMFERPLEAKQRIGYMPEACPLYPEMRVNEYLAYRAELKGVAGRQIPERIAIALNQASVSEVSDRIIGQLSKGTRQRVGLADALVADPPILVLDEPTAGLDPNQIRQVRDLIRGFAGKKTVLVSTHILPEVEATCQRVVIIHRGKVVREGTPEDLRGAVDSARRLMLKSKSKRAALEPVLLGVAGVLAIESEEAEAGLTRMVVRVAEDPEVGERIFEAVAKAGLTLRHLQPLTSASLEDVFGKLTTTDAAAAADDEEDDEEEADSSEKDGEE